jgi:hypothetical protein
MMIGWLTTSLFCLAVSKAQVDSALRPTVLHAGDMFTAKATSFVFSRAQVESLTVRMDEAVMTREKNRTLHYLDSLHQVQLFLKDTLLNIKDRQIALFRQNEDELMKELDRQTPWYKSGLFHFVLGGATAAVFTKLAIDYLNAIKK